ncbi:MAG: class I SAM-dependent methyltransferase, partial [Acidobacteria bacterium]|nr:class I SAM-dependent methyltransferase [Acidobacteriota bacterium]
IGLGLTTGLVLAVSLELYRRLPAYIALYHDRTDAILSAKVNLHFRQTEALLSLYASVRLNRPLASTREWAASPDFLLKLSELIFLRKPELVIELGSGVSTVIIASCLRQNGKGKLISLDHDPKYAQATRDAVMLHDLQDIVSVIYAPLQEVEVSGRRQPWYDIGQLNPDRSIDLLVIDGPPLSVGELARYPALPMLADKLSGDAIIILDDAARPDERQVVAQWENEFQEKVFRYIDLEKGACVISNGPMNGMSKGV